jgi:hypothetical protein
MDFISDVHFTNPREKFSMGFHADAKFGFMISQRYPQTHSLSWLHALITDSGGKTLVTDA